MGPAATMPTGVIPPPPCPSFSTSSHLQGSGHQLLPYRLSTEPIYLSGLHHTDPQHLQEPSEKNSCLEFTASKSLWYPLNSGIKSLTISVKLRAAQGPLASSLSSCPFFSPCPPPLPPWAAGLSLPGGQHPVPRFLSSHLQPLPAITGLCGCLRVSGNDKPRGNFHGNVCVQRQVYLSLLSPARRRATHMHRQRGDPKQADGKQQNYLNLLENKGMGIALGPCITPAALVPSKGRSVEPGRPPQKQSDGWKQPRVCASCACIK